MIQTHGDLFIQNPIFIGNIKSSILIGKHSNPQDHHLSYDVIIRNHEHYCNMEFIKVNIIYKSILKLVILFQTLQLIAQGPLQVFMKNPKIFTNKSS